MWEPAEEGECPCEDEEDLDHKLDVDVGYETDHSFFIFILFFFFLLLLLSSISSSSSSPSSSSFTCPALHQLRL